MRALGCWNFGDGFTFSPLRISKMAVFKHFHRTCEETRDGFIIFRNQLLRPEG